jgi:hypothetical protein
MLPLIERDPVAIKSSIPAIIISQTGNNNVGHVIGDEIWPAFQALDSFGGDVFNSQFVTRKTNSAFEMFYNFLSDHERINMNAFGDQRHCYETLYVGVEGTYLTLLLLMVCCLIISIAVPSY